MTGRRPKDMSDLELSLLPTGPYEEEFVPYTAEESTSGAVAGRGRIRIKMRPTMATYYMPDDWVGWRDANGQAWTFGQFADGSWFKQASPI
ncbi:MAG: hypothetical protein Q8R02_23525 [Hyphomonadaceae bacterium]|nr:hypothetical protein [Hyphomonadaceae bacterium]